MKGTRGEAMQVSQGRAFEQKETECFRKNKETGVAEERGRK